MSELYERSGKTLTINPHGGQLRAWDSTSKIILVCAGNQSGKTVFGPVWMYREIQNCGPGDYLAASVNYDLFKLKMLPAMTGLFVDCLGWSYHAGDKILVNPAGDTRIILRSAVARGSLESSTAKAAWCDEWGQDDVDITHWEALQRRVGKHQGRILITTTPYNLGWLKCAVYDRWKGGDKDYDVVNFRTIDNPSYPLEEYERAKRTLPDWRFRMFYDGEFTKPAGLIYGDYEDSYREYGGNLVKPFSIPDHWLRDVGVDFGGSIHNAQIWIAEDPESHDLYAYREVCGIDNTGPEQARAAAEYREPVRRAIGGAPSEDDQRLNWGNAGFTVMEPYISEVEAGIDRVIGLFKTRRLYIFDSLTGLRSELGTYSRELDDAGEPLQKIKDKEKFHRLDALRYVCTYYPLDREINRPQVDTPMMSAAGIERMFGGMEE